MGLRRDEASGSRGWPLASLFLVTAGLFVLLIVVAAAHFVREVDDDGRERTEQQLLDTTRALSLVVDGELQSYAATLKALATSEALARGDYRAFDARARQLLAGPDAWIILFDRQGRQLINTRLPANANLPVARLPAEVWRSLDRGETRVCNLAKGMIERRILCVDHPIMRDGRAAFGLSVVFRPQYLQKIMQRQKLPATRYGTILDRNNIVAWRNVDGAKLVGKSATPDMVEALRHSEEGVKESVSLNGVPTIAAYSRSARSGWTFIVAVRRGEISEASSRARSSGLLVAGGLLLLAALLALGVGQWLSVVIRRLAAAAGHDSGFRLAALSGTGVREIDDVAATLHRSHIEREENQERLHRMNVTLEEAVAKRTSELTAALDDLHHETEERLRAEEALRQSQKMESIGQVTGGVAHDFNNLLTPIVGGLDLLRRRNLDERSLRLVDGASQAAERARVLVQRLLAFARRQPLQPSGLNIGELVTGIRDLLASTLGPRVEISVEVASDLLPARADQNQLELALLNLAVNARDAMADGGRLTISVNNEEAGPAHEARLPLGDYVCIAVTDTGCGMDAATLSRAVEPFFSTKGVGKGTGLGLSMAHGLAAQLGGGLSLSSAVGMGTTVKIWLPVTPAATPDAHQADADEKATSTDRTVLVVDDEDLVRESVAEMLSISGYAVSQAETAAQALSLFESGLRVDVLVTDHLMPGMTGTELARITRERGFARAVLIISGYADVDDIPPDVVRLTKPFRQEELAAAMCSATADFEPEQK